MTIREDSPRIVDNLRELSKWWKQPLSEDNLDHFITILAQHPDNILKFQNMSDSLQNNSMWNYIYRDSTTPIFLYFDALEVSRWGTVPIDTNNSPRDWMKELDRMSGIKKPSNVEFLRVVRWFDYYLSRSSSIVLYLLANAYGEEIIVRMGFKLAEFKCDIRVIDFVSLAKDWENESLDCNFNFWTSELYRYRTLSDESVIKSSHIPI